jgi:DNA topoisomerase-1
MGHLRDLPKSQLGVDIEHDFEPRYITVRGKGELLAKLKKQAKVAQKVYLATDPDREGEAISWHLSKVLNVDESKTARIAFNEITKTAVKDSIKNARDIDKNLVDAQQARRVLDRVVGYKISPILWRKVKKGLSAGRVQSVATDMIVRRQREIDAFEPQEYWTIDALFKEKFSARFHGKEKKIALEDKRQTDGILAELKGADYVVKSVKRAEKKRNPAPPFITSTLQQEASRKLNFNSKRTMSLAQQLYEGVNIPGRGVVGLITYMRTDSLRISNEALGAVRGFIKNEYGDKFLPGSPRFYRSKKNAQDAHEAVRPTYVEITPELAKNSMDAPLYKLYKLIWDRFVASQMESAVLDTISVEITANDYIFRASGMKIKFAGFMKLYIEGRDEEEEKAKQLPDLAEGQRLNLSKLVPEQHFTAPPPNYTEATLIKAMEEEGIGRPSTYAPTISTIISRGYVNRKGKTLFPTELGTIVAGLLAEYFDKIVNMKFTASIEEQLDSVEDGKRDWVDVLRDFYPDFSVALDKAEAEIGQVELKDEVSDIPCEKCGRMMVYKIGRYGRFLACPGFPECRNTKAIVVEAGVNCPVCGAKVLIKKSKRGKVYYGCERNGNGCEFMSWDMPTDKKCEKCGAVMVKKRFKGQERIVCSNKECKKTARKGKKG